MKEKLVDLSLYELIELSCGNLLVLLSDGEKRDNAVIEKAASSIIEEYNNIVNQSRMKTVLADIESKSKRNARLLLYNTCNILLSIGAYDDVCKILKAVGISVPDTAEAAREKLNRLIKEIEFATQREAYYESKNGSKSTNTNVRGEFSREIAFIMTYYKMNIDTRSTNAEVYANIVRQANAEIKAQKASTK